MMLRTYKSLDWLLEVTTEKLLNPHFLMYSTLVLGFICILCVLCTE